MEIYNGQASPVRSEVQPLAEPESLSGDEVLLLIEALDALLPQREENQRLMTADERERWALYWTVRRRLKAFEKCPGEWWMELCRKSEKIVSESLEIVRVAEERTRVAHWHEYCLMDPL